MSMIKKYIDFREFLKDDDKLEFQITSLSVGNFREEYRACSADLEKSKKLISEKSLLVEVVEKFDEFLIQLKRLLRPKRFDPRYSR